MIDEITISNLSNRLEGLHIDNGMVLSAKVNPRVYSKLIRKYHGSKFVYLIFENQDVVYVGSTTNLYQRMIAHSKDKNIDEVLLLQYDTYENMSISERTIIRDFKPRLNKTLYN